MQQVVVCCSVLQYGVVCYSVQTVAQDARASTQRSVFAEAFRVALCCSVLQCVAVFCSVLKCVTVCCNVLQCDLVCCSVLRCVAVCCSVLECAVVCYSVLQYVTVCCSVLQCVAVCCSVLQCVAVCCSVHNTAAQDARVSTLQNVFAEVRHQVNRPQTRAPQPPTLVRRPARFGFGV